MAGWTTRRWMRPLGLATLGLSALALTGFQDSSGRVAVEYGQWQVQAGSCRPIRWGGGVNPPPAQSVIPGVPAPQECRQCRPVRRCTARETARAPVRCVTGRECEWVREGSQPRGRSIG